MFGGEWWCATSHPLLSGCPKFYSQMKLHSILSFMMYRKVSKKCVFSQWSEQGCVWCTRLDMYVILQNAQILHFFLFLKKVEGGGGWVEHSSHVSPGNMICICFAAVWQMWWYWLCGGCVVVSGGVPPATHSIVDAPSSTAR